MYLHGTIKTECISNIIATIAKLKSLGFIIHAEKFILIPTQKLDTSGFNISSVSMTVSLKETKKQDLFQIIYKTIKKKFIKIRKWSQVRRKIMVSLSGSMYGALYCQHLELSEQKALKNSKESFAGYVKLPKES